jgi:hypothetical protein
VKNHSDFVPSEKGCSERLIFIGSRWFACPTGTAGKWISENPKFA